MGRYLCIGINKQFSLTRQELEERNLREQDVKSVLERDHMILDVYDVVSDNEGISFSLKQEIIEKEWIPFLSDFYRARYDGTVRQAFYKEVLEQLGKCRTAEEYLELPLKHSTYVYHYDRQPFFLYDKSFKSPCLVSSERLILSVDGKIIMECYDDILRFLLRTFQGARSVHHIVMLS